MSDTVETLREYGASLVGNVRNTADIADARVKLFGKNGVFTKAMRELKDVSKENRPRLGKAYNDVKVLLEGMIAEKENAFAEAEKRKRIESEYIDVTLPGTARELGSLHPITLVKDEILDAFIGLGFKVEEGPEIESDYYNFQLLNIPADHPARDMQDTFYITDTYLLRTHTSPMQARVMLKEKPPIRIVVPGRVYRNDDDSTHSPMFHQIEGLVVDKKITLCDLKGALEVFARKVFDEQTKIRFRPSYFPFTEPSVEVDVSCPFCKGRGCRVCKSTGWVEILGAGVVNPVVLDGVGIDSSVYSGFAFGLGLERIAMMKYGIPDIRLFFENDVRFLGLYR